MLGRYDEGFTAVSYEIILFVIVRFDVKEVDSWYEYDLGIDRVEYEMGEDGDRGRLGDVMWYRGKYEDRRVDSDCRDWVLFGDCRD